MINNLETAYGVALRLGEENRTQRAKEGLVTIDIKMGVEYFYWPWWRI